MWTILQAQFDQKRLTHILEMKKIDPDFNEGEAWGRVLFATDRPIKELWDRDDSIPGKAFKKKIGEIEKAVGR